MAPKKSTKSAPAEVAPASTPVEQKVDPVAVPEVVVPSVPEVEDPYVSILKKLATWQTEIKELVALVKVLQKTKGTRKARKDSSNTKRTPSGFAKPTLLSDDLCDFLALPRGSALARTEVTRVINKYVKDNKLQDPNDKRTILLDAKLGKLITLKSGEKLTYFNLQTFIKHHFLGAPPS